MRIAFFGDSLTEGTSGACFLSPLRKTLPGHSLLNLGKGGETVRSLLRRIRRTALDPPPDLSFIWVGVNDVLAQTSPLYGFIKLARRQPWTSRPESFGRVYARLLDEILGFSRRVYAVSPLFIGEDLDGPWNIRLSRFDRIIRRTAEDISGADYFDLRAVFLSRLSPENAPAFRTRGLWTRLREKGNPAPSGVFQFTVDGIHLNQAGAELASLSFQRIIEVASRSLECDLDT